MKYIAYTIGTVSFLYILIANIFFGYVNSSSKTNWENMQQSTFTCPKGTEVTYRGWSENGNLRYCEPLKTGYWEAWMSGYKWVDGYYKNGKRHGQWTNYNSDGSVHKVTEYNNGIEVNNK